jgi:PAS domain S-box-containing protein
MPDPARRAERRFVALANAMAEVVWAANAAGMIVHPVPSLERFTGRSFEELAGHGWLECVHPDDRARLLAEWEVAKRHGGGFSLEHRMRRADGEWRLMEARGAPVVEDGALLEWIGVNVDVTDRRAMESQLRASEARLARAQEITGIGTWEFDAASGRTYVSANVARMHGVEHLAGFSYDDWLAALSPEEREDATASIATALRDGTPYRQVTNFRRPDGTVVVTEARAERVVDADGRVRLLGTVQDITERVERDRALRESEQRLALIFNSAFDSMYLVSVDGPDEFRVRLVNAAFTRITGVPADEVIGRELREIAKDQDAAIQVANYREVVRTRAVVEYEERYEIQEREQVMETRLIPVMRPGAAVTHVLGISRDVSERRRMERERQALDLQLLHTQKLESLGVLAGGVAHDFNNLLVGILGNASLALLDLDPGSEVAEMVGDIEKTARQAAELTTQLLAYSGKGRFVVAATDLVRLVRDMSPVWRSGLGKRAAVTLELAEGLPPVEGDAAQLRQVVLNMITNAVDALGGDTGRVVVRAGVERLDARAIASARFSVSAEPGEFVFVEVEDDGCGMDAQTLERIFDPFFTTKFTGRGLGLAATLGIVRGDRGVIRVRSSPGAGTTFHVALPARRDLVSAPAAAPAPLRAGVGTVLVIDDEAAVRSAVRRILDRAGYTVLEAAEGDGGIAAFREGHARIGCVVVDLTMPGMDGVEVATAIRGLAPDVRIVLSSGFDAASVAGLPLGNHVFLHKPFTAGQLLEAVGRGTDVE